MLSRRREWTIQEARNTNETDSHYFRDSLCTTFSTITQSIDPKTPVIMASQPSADIRLYKNRASYSLRAALDIFREGMVAHVAFVHPGDEEGESKQRRKETIMNIPLITVMVCKGEDEDDQDSYVVYLHS